MKLSYFDGEKRVELPNACFFLSISEIGERVKRMNGENPTTNDGKDPSGTSIQMTITWNQMTGACQVTGPINNSVLAYGILEAAKDAIRKYLSENQQAVVLAPKVALRM